MSSSKTIKQCKSCPWRVDCDPDRDIPTYSRKLHEKLSCTIRNGIESFGETRAMACHYSKVGKESFCAGWLSNQLGPGNNIGLRFRAMLGLIPTPRVDGEQHASFEDTLSQTRR